MPLAVYAKFFSVYGIISVLPCYLGLLYGHWVLLWLRFQTYRCHLHKVFYRLRTDKPFSSGSLYCFSLGLASRIAMPVSGMTVSLLKGLWRYPITYRHLRRYVNRNYRTLSEKETPEILLRTRGFWCCRTFLDVFVVEPRLLINQKAEIEFKKDCGEYWGVIYGYFESNKIQHMLPQSWTKSYSR